MEGNPSPGIRMERVVLQQGETGDAYPEGSNPESMRAGGYSQRD
jgi:hypothetical protein